MWIKKHYKKYIWVWTFIFYAIYKCQGLIQWICKGDNANISNKQRLFSKHRVINSILYFTRMRKEQWRLVSASLNKKKVAKIFTSVQIYVFICNFNGYGHMLYALVVLISMKQP